jgi:PAS domain S-box-containing protein
MHRRDAAIVTQLRADLDPLAALDPALLAALTQTANEIVTIADPSGRILFVGGALRESVGLDPEQRIGGTLFERVHPEDRPQLAQRLREFVADESLPDRSGIISYRNQHVDGSYRHRETELTRMRRGGRTALVIAHTRDVTAELRVLERSAEAELRLETVIWGADIGLVELDLVRDEISWSGDWCERHGIDAGAGPGHFDRWRALIHPEDLERMEAQRSAAGTPPPGRWMVEYRIHDRDGNWLWIMEQGRVAQRRANGQPARMAAVMIIVDELKRLRRELDESRDRLQVAIDGAEIAIWEWDLATRRVRRNAHWYRLMGLTVPADVGTRTEQLDFDRVHVDDRAAVDAVVAAHVQGLTPGFEFEARCLCGDGAWRWRLSRGRVVERSAAGAPLRVVGCLLDIHQRKLAEHQLAASAVRYKAATELAVDFVTEWSVDASGGVRLEWASGAFESIVGCDPAQFEAVGGWTAFLHPDDAQRVAPLLQGLLEGHNTEGDYRIVRRDGAVRWIGSVNQPVRDPSSGAVLRFICAGTDLGRHDRDGLSVAESQALQRLMVDTVPACLVLVEPDLRIRLAGQPIFGRSPDVLHGTDYVALFATDARERIRAAFARSAASLANLELEAAPADPGYAALLYRIHLAPISTGGVLRGWCVVTRDITETRRAERQAFQALAIDQQRIAHDLHDGVGQQLTGAALMLQSLSLELAQQGHPRSAEAAQLSQLLTHAVEDVRVLGRSLSPVGSARHGLAAAMRGLAERARSSGKVEVSAEIDVQSADTLSPLDADHVFLIAEEAVSNALRHAGAQRLALSLRLRGHAFELLVADDGGDGQTHAAAARDGAGLQLMAHRARGLGATLTIVPREPSGTLLTCSRG